MKFDLLGGDERKQMRAVRMKQVQDELLALEREFYLQELEYRTAAGLSPPDQARMDAARAAQSAADARYAARRPDLESMKLREG